MQTNMKTKDFKLPDKVFQERNSVLTDFLENKHVKSFYNIFIAMFIIQIFSATISDLRTFGTYVMNFPPLFFIL